MVGGGWVVEVVVSATVVVGWVVVVESGSVESLEPGPVVSELGGGGSVVGGGWVVEVVGSAAVVGALVLPGSVLAGTLVSVVGAAVASPVEEGAEVSAIVLVGSPAVPAESMGGALISAAVTPGVLASAEAMGDADAAPPWPGCADPWRSSPWSRLAMSARSPRARAGSRSTVRFDPSAIVPVMTMNPAAPATPAVSLARLAG